MKPHVKVPPPPSLPQGLIALVTPPSRRTTPAESVESRAAAGSSIVTEKETETETESIEETRAWRPNRDLLQTDPQPGKLLDFASAAEEPTMVGAIDLNDPSLFRSAPPPAPDDGAELGSDDDEGAAVEFVGALAALDRDEPPDGAEEQTKLYRPQRLRLEPEELTDEFESPVMEEAPALGPAPPKVILAPAVLADAQPDPTRAEATRKKKRQALPGNDSKVGLGMCLLGGLALVLGVAWRHPRTAPATHDAIARVATVATQLLGR